jgi:hypothetical protein
MTKKTLKLSFIIVMSIAAILLIIIEYQKTYKIIKTTGDTLKSTTLKNKQLKENLELNITKLKSENEELRTENSNLKQNTKTILENNLTQKTQIEELKKTIEFFKTIEKHLEERIQSYIFELSIKDRILKLYE